MTTSAINEGTTPQIQENPYTIQLRFSDDGGYTWCPPFYLPVGTLGNYKQLVRQWRLGITRNRVYEILYTGATDFSLFGGELDLTPTDGTA